jgi:UbiD family decarboxylase
MKKIAEGQPLQAIFTAFSVDHGIKMVIVVDEDIDVFNEKEVLWAMSTRLQADRGVVTTSQQIGMGVTLDPSTDELSRTAKFGIDATKPAAGFATVMKVEEEVRRRILPLLS